MTEFDYAALPGWRLGDAKAQFSKVVRLAASGQPQRVTVHGRDTAVILSVGEFQRLQALGEGTGLHDLLSSSPLNRLDFGHEGVRSPVREVDL